MNCRPFQVTLAMLVVLTMLVTACAPTATPPPTARPTSAPAPTPVSALHPGWTTYTTDDGLVSNMVHAMTVAPDGTLWFGTVGGGVSHFDGETWTNYSFDEMGVTEVGSYGVMSLAVSPDGALWAGTDLMGVFRYDGETWTNYTEEDGLAGEPVSSIAVTPDGALWFGTGGGLCRYLPPD